MSPHRRRKEHHALIMFRWNKIGELLDNYRPNIDLCEICLSQQTQVLGFVVINIFHINCCISGGYM